MAYLEFPGSICFHLCDPINIVSNSEVPGIHTHTVEGVDYKHAIITRSTQQIFQITDLCTNDTYIKAVNGTEFELLPTMQPNQLVSKDQVRFGDTIARFHMMSPDDIIESSQCSETVDTPNTSKAGKMLAPETEDLRQTYDSEMIDVFIPETQVASVGTTEGVDLLEGTATENQGQLIVSSMSVEEFVSMTPEEPVKQAVKEAQGDATIETEAQDGTPSTEVDSQDGWPLPENSLQSEPEQSSTKESGNEEAQDKSKETAAEVAQDEAVIAEVNRGEGAQAEAVIAEVNQGEAAQPETVGPEMSHFESDTFDDQMAQVLSFDSVQAFMQGGPEEADDASSRESHASSEFFVRDRKSEVHQTGRLSQSNPKADQKEQADSDDSEGQNAEQENISMNQQTQAAFSPGFRTRHQIKLQADIKPKTISLTQFDDTERMSPPPKKTISLFAMETQPMTLPDEPSLIPSSTKTKPKRGNKILDSSDDEDFGDAKTSPIVRGILKDLSQSSPSDKQSTSKRSSSSMKPSPSDKQSTSKRSSSSVKKEPSDKPTTSKRSNSSEKQEQPSQPSQSTKSPGAPGSPKTPTRTADSSMSIDESTPDILPKLPSDSQYGDILELVNATQSENESVMMFDAIDDSSSEMQQELVKPKEPEGMDPPKKKIKIMKYDKDDEGTPGKERPKRNAIKRNFGSFAMSSNLDSTIKQKVESASFRLSGAVTDEMKKAEFYLTDKKLKMTTKFLAAICKGIPIVDEDFLDASLKAKTWQDPWKYVIANKDIEKQRGCSLHQVLTDSMKKKVLQGVTGYVTKHFKYPVADMKEIIESGGGECISHAKTPKKGNKVAIFYNPDDTAEFENLKKKHPKANFIKASEVLKVVLSQIPLK